MAETSEEKNQAATPHKLREARKQGQVAKSLEANYAVVLVVLVVACFALLPSFALRVESLARRLLNDAQRSDWASDHVSEWLLQQMHDGLSSLAPVLLAIVCAALAVNIAQTGAVFSTTPITPDFSRLNPAKGIEKLFSKRVFYDAARSVAKLALLSYIAWKAIDGLVPALMRSSYLDIHALPHQILDQATSLLCKLLAGVVLIAAVDLAYSRYEFAKKMRMSHKDVSDEHKQREGDPRIRSRMRQLRLEMLKQARAARDLPKADVLITNPTHIAIAISYRHGEMPAPKLLCKASGKLALRLREAARTHRIPVVENRPLARALFKQAGADDYVPEQLYPQVARILLWVYVSRRQAKGEAA